VPIFNNALAMYRDHPVNGVGVRAFRKAYVKYAEPDDIHYIQGGDETRAHQAHNFVLEFMADTGTIGLLGFLAAVVFGIRYWHSLGDHSRQQAFPYAVALLAIVFPLNSYFAFFGVYMMSVTWVLVGLMTAATLNKQSANLE
jgi:O-antigen ligase